MSERINRAREIYEHSKSEEGLPGPPGIEFDSSSQTDEHRGSRIEKKSATKRQASKPIEEIWRQETGDDRAYKTAKDEGILNEEGDINIEEIYDFIESLDGKAKEKAEKAVREYEESLKKKSSVKTYSGDKTTPTKEEKGVVEVTPGVTVEKATLDRIIIEQNTKRGRKKRPRRRPERSKENKQRHFAYDAYGVENWEKKQREGKKQPLFLDARDWESQRAIEVYQNKRKKEISKIKNGEERKQERKIWTIIEDKLRRNRNKLLREVGPRPQEMYKPFQAYNEKELRVWLRDQRRAMKNGETKLRKLTLIASSDAGVAKLEKIKDELKEQYDRLPDGDKKNQEWKIFKEYRRAYNSARWFVNKQKRSRQKQEQAR